MFVKTNDKVLVIAGKDAGKQGKVVTAAPQVNKVVVEGVAMVTKHQKSRAQGQPGGIIKKEAYIDASNVMVICPKCGKPIRVAHKLVEKTGKDGASKMKSVRACPKCNAEID